MHATQVYKRGLGYYKTYSTHIEADFGSLQKGALPWMEGSTWQAFKADKIGDQRVVVRYVVSFNVAWSGKGIELMVKAVSLCIEAAMFVTFRSQGRDNPFFGRGQRPVDATLKLLNGPGAVGKWVYVCDIKLNMAHSKEVKAGMVFFNQVYADYVDPSWVAMFCK